MDKKEKLMDENAWKNRVGFDSLVYLKERN